MAITFPTSPSNGDTITSGDVTWTFDGEKWKHNIRGTAGVAYSVSADSGSTDTIEIGVDTLNIEGGTGINTVVSNNNVKVDIANTAVTPGTYGSTSNVPTITVDQQGRITGIGTASNIPVEGGGVTDAITNAADIVQGTQYSIFELGTTNFPTTFGAQEDTAGSFVTNEHYIISSAGDTNWATVGASVTTGNEVGVLFRAVGAGSAAGNPGKAIRRIFTASSNGTGSSGTGKVKENVAHFPVFVDARSGTPLLQTSAGFTFFPSLDKITASNLDGDFAGTFRGEFAGTFFGALDSSVTGNVPSASEIVIANVEDAGADHFISFVEATSGTKAIAADSSLKYSPRTDTITVDNLSGSASKSLAVDVFQNSVAGTLKPVFTSTYTATSIANATSAVGEGQAVWYQSTNNKIVLVYINNSGGTPELETSIGTPSTTSRTISWATPVDSTLDPAVGANIAISTIDSTRFLVTYKENSTNHLKSVVVTYDTSANSVSFGTPTTIVSSAVGSVIRAARDTSSESSAASRFKTVIAYTKGTNLHARALTIHNGTNALTLGTETSALNSQAVTTTRPVFDLVHYGLEEAWLLVCSETSTNNFFKVLNTASSGPNNVNITANTGQSFLGSGTDIDVNVRVIEGVRNNTTTHNSVVVVYNSGSDIKAKIIYIGNTPGIYSVAGSDAKEEQTVVTGKTATSMTLALDSTNREVFLFASTSDNKGKVSRGTLSADSDGFLVNTSWKPFIEVINTNTNIGGYNVLYDTLSKQWLWTTSKASEVVKYNLVTLGAGLLESDEGFTYDPSTNTLVVGTLSATDVTIGGGGSNSISNTVIGNPSPAAGTFTTLAATSITIDSTALTSTAAELNILDGATLTTAELNILDGVTATAAELNILDGVTATAAEINALDGITAVVGELNALDLGSTAIGTAVASKAVVIDANKDYSGIRNFTADKFIGDVYSSNGSSKVLEAGTDGTDATFTGNVTGDLTGNASTATTLATARNVEITGAVTAGPVTFNGSGDLTLNTVLGGSAGTISVGADSSTAQDVSFSTSGARLDIDGTSNEIEATVSKTGEVVTVQLGLPNDVTIGQDLTVTRNLIVNGDTTTISTTNTLVKDSLIELGNGTTGSPTNDAGIVIERGDTANAFIGFDESEDKFVVGTGSFTGASTGNLTISTGTLVANLEGAVTGNADTATLLQNARTIGGVSFNGSANINLPGVNTEGNQNTTGNAATSNQIKTITRDTDAEHFISFVDSDNVSSTAENLYTDESLKYNPHTGTLSATSFSGDFQGSSTSSTNVTVTENSLENGSHYVTFVDGTTSSRGIEVDTGLQFNPFTNTLSGGAETLTIVGKLSGTANRSGNATIFPAGSTDAENEIPFSAPNADSVTTAASIASNAADNVHTHAPSLYYSKLYNKYLAFWAQTSTGILRYNIGTYSSGSITWGTVATATYSSANIVCAQRANSSTQPSYGQITLADLNPASNILMSLTEVSGSNKVNRLRVLTFNGSTVTFGAPTDVESTSSDTLLGAISITRDPTDTSTNRTLVTHIDTEGDPKALIATISSGGSITLGSELGMSNSRVSNTDHMVQYRVSPDADFPDNRTPRLAQSDASLRTQITPTFSAPDLAGGAQATGTFDWTFESGDSKYYLTGITMTNTGRGYTTGPTYTGANFAGGSSISDLAGAPGSGGSFPITNTAFATATQSNNDAMNIDASWSGIANKFIVAIGERQASVSNPSQSNGYNNTRILTSSGTNLSASSINGLPFTNLQESGDIRTLGDIEYTESNEDKFGIIVHSNKYRKVIVSSSTNSHTYGSDVTIDSSVNYNDIILANDPVTKEVILLTDKSSGGYVFKRAFATGSDISFASETQIDSNSVRSGSRSVLVFDSTQNKFIISKVLSTNTQPLYQQLNITDSKLQSKSTFSFNPSTNALTAGSFIKSGAGSAAVLIGNGGAVNHGAADVASTIVSRDASGNFSANQITADLTGDISGNAGTATILATARNIGGVSFNGSSNIDLPGVNTAGSQDTSGNAATATKLAATKTIGGVAFDGSANINLPGVNAAGSQDTTGNAATATTATTAGSLNPGAKIHVDNSSGGTTFTGASALDLRSDVYAFMKKALITNAGHTGLSVASDDSNFAFDITTASASSVGTTADNSTNASRFLTFVDSAVATQGLKTDTGLTYNPNENKLTLTRLTDGTAELNAGALTGLTNLSSTTITDGTLSINSGSIASVVNITASGTVEYGSLTDGSITITEFVDEDNMVSDSPTKIPTQQSVKAYVDTTVSDATPNASTTVKGVAQFNSDDFSVSSGNVSLKTVNSNTGSFGSGTVVPVLTIDGEGRITAASTANVSAAAVELEVKADGAGARNVTIGQDHLNFVADEGINVAIAADTDSADTKITISAEDATASNKGIASFTNNFSVSSGAVSLADTGVSAASYGSATEIPQITIDAKGRITAASTNALTTSMTLAGDSGSESFSTGNTITFDGNGPITTTVSLSGSNAEVDINIANATAGGNAAGATEGIASFNNANFDVSGGFVSLKADGIVLGTNTTGNYVKNITAASGSGLQSTVNSAGEGIEPSLSLDLMGLSAATVDVANDSFAFIDANNSNLPKKDTIADLVAAIAGNNLTASGGVLAGQPGTVTSVSGGAGLTGSITSTGSLAVGAGTGITVAADSISTNDSEIVHDNLSGFVATEHIDHAGLSITTTNGITGGGTLDSSRTFSLDTTVVRTTGAQTIAGDKTFSNNIVVDGNLTVSGTTTTINTDTISIEDNMIELARNNTASDSVDFGLYGVYDSSGSQDLYSGLFRDAGTDKWKFFKGSQTVPANTTVNESATGYTIATVVANFEGDLTGDVYAANGTSKILEAGTDGTDATFTGAVTGTATNATNVQVTATNTTNNTYYIPFVSASGSQTAFKSLGSDTQLKYNPSSGVLESGNIKGNLEGNVQGNLVGNVTGNVTGSLTGGITGNSATASSLQTARNIQGVAFDGTSDIDLTEPVQDIIGAQFVTNATNRGISYTYQDAGNGAMDGTVTALYNGTAEKLGTTATTLAVKAHIIPDTNDTYDIGSATHKFRKIFVEEGQFAASTITVGTKTISADNDGIIVGGDLTATNLTGTLTGNVTGTVTGAATSAATLTTARDITIGSTNHSFDGSANINLTEAVQDAVAAMFTHSNHTSVSASYDDTNGEIDLTSSGGSGSAGDPIVSISENAPSSPSTGSLWFDPSDLTPYLYYNDGNSAQWVEFTPGGGTSSGLTIQDEGSALSTDATTLNFVGTGVTVTGTGATKTVTISGGGGGGDLTIAADSGSNDDVTVGTDTLTFSGGEGIDTAVSNNAITISAEDASSSNKGIASFDATDFTVSSGAVTVNAERVQDIVGAMLTGNTESGIAVTYEDSDGTVDFAVSLSGFNTDSLSEGTNNKYYTDARVDARIANNIIDEDAMGSDSATRAPSQQSVKAYVASQIATKDNTDEITEGSTNLYYTDARAQAVSINNVVEDTSPELGGNLDLGTNSIVTVSNRNLTLAPDGTGKVVISSPLQVGAFTLPETDGTANQVLITDGSGNLAWGDPPARGVQYLRVEGLVNIQTGTARWYPPGAATVTKLVARVNTAPTGANMNLTLNKVSSGSTTTTNLVIAAGQTKVENTSPSLSLGADDYLTLDVTQVGSTEAGRDLQLLIVYTF